MSDSVMTNIVGFRMEDVLNTDPYCVNALDKDIAYLTAFDTDKLLAGFRETAGLDTNGASRYEGWESTLIGGHSIGHYLSAIAQAYVNPGVSDEDKNTLFDIMSTIIDGLLICQKNSKGKENFLFGAVIVDKENVEKQFDNIEKNKTNIITEAWVPWYTLHKILAGVLDTYKLTGYANALEVAKRIGDWAYNRAMGWDSETALQVIRVEYGGMNEVLYELYSLTNEDKYAVVAHYFDAIDLFERVNEGKDDVLNNHHANTTIPKFIGALHRYIACHGKTINGEKIDATKYLEYAMNFWQMVVDKHTYVTGGNSEWEHFGKDYILDRERTNCNCETCNIYNMLKFSKTLFCITGDVKYANYYENAFINTILSSQNPETGMTTYFQPMSTGYFKVFGKRFNKFWCCTGTGMENFTKLNDSIFFHNEDYIIVNLYESAVLDWKEKLCKLTINANLQTSDTVEITIEDAKGSELAVGLALRIPDWISGDPILKINGETKDYTLDKDYIIVEKGLASGSKISLTLPMKITLEALKDNNRSVAFKYGPTVLSANLGCEDMATTTTGMMVTIPAGKISDWDEIVFDDDATLNDFFMNPEKYMIREDEGGKLSFKLTINGLKFAPHFSRYKERYGIYFIACTNQEKETAKKEKEQRLLDKPEGKIIDTVQPGYGQYENDELHKMWDWGGSVGSTENGTTRYAKSGGFFGYWLRISENENNYLSLTLMKEDCGKSLKIYSGDEVFFEEVIEYDGDEATFEIRVQIPKVVVDSYKTVTANNEEHKVVPICFKGSQGAQSARLFGFLYVMNY